MKLKHVPLAALLLASIVSSVHAADEVADAMSKSANELIATFSNDQKATALYPFSEDRKGWHFIPKEREGLSLADMSDEQDAIVFELLGQGLSSQGVHTLKEVMSLESVLAIMEGEGRRFPRSPELYHVWIFGTPGSAHWGWRFEGHHISVNATVVEGQGVSMSPTFIGSNPAEVPSGDRKGFRALPSEEDVGFKLVLSLNAEQRAKAVYDTTAPNDVISFIDRKTKPLPIAGLSAKDMNKSQMKTLKKLVNVFLKRNKSAIYDRALAVVEDGGWENVVFGWAGSLERHKGNYYFVQGPGFLIEYDNTQNNNNHIHCVWREFDGDFGDDLLMRHHEEHHHH